MTENITIEHNFKELNGISDSAKDLYNSSIIVQGLWVFASMFGLFIYIMGRVEQILPKSTILTAFNMGWPVLVSFFIWLIPTSSYLSKPSRERISLEQVLKIIKIFIFTDVVLLGALVFQTGGPSNSIFTPLLLLHTNKKL